MAFNSFQYGLFLPLVLLLYWRLDGRNQNRLLLVASYIFYGAWNWRFLSLLAISTLTDYTVAKALARTSDEARRRLLLAVSVAVNLGILATFKYFNFFADSLVAVLDAIGLGISSPVLEVVLPVGISFYTFQTMAYTIDVYRRRLEPEQDLLRFAVYVAFFPQLVAGPIERARRLLPQLSGRRAFPSSEQLRSGALLILLGLFKKVAIADALAPTVDRAFAGAGTESWLTLLVGVYAFALQIYADFSGYTDIARGSARLLGIELMENFSQPYLSRNITHFWRTWHMSLSSWLRDYLYIPLGGSRTAGFRTARNLMLTMLLGGLWHGAAWTFVVWGGLHGLFLSVDRLLRRGHTDMGGAVEGKRPANAPFRPADVLPAFATFNLVCLAWIFFRADSFTAAWQYLVGIVSLRPGPVDPQAVALLIPAAVAVFLIDLAQRNAGDHAVMLRWPAVARGAFYGACCVAVLLFSGQAPVPFIYFQF